LIVDSDTVLPRPIAGKSLQAVPGWDAEVSQAFSRVELIELPACCSP